jgi:hypothetical protein
MIYHVYASFQFSKSTRTSTTTLVLRYSSALIESHLHINRKPSPASSPFSELQSTDKEESGEDKMVDKKAEEKKVFSAQLAMKIKVDTSRQ